MQVILSFLYVLFSSVIFFIKYFYLTIPLVLPLFLISNKYNIYSVTAIALLLASGAKYLQAKRMLIDYYSSYVSLVVSALILATCAYIFSRPEMLVVKNQDFKSVLFFIKISTILPHLLLSIFFNIRKIFFNKTNNLHMISSRDPKDELLATYLFRR